MKLDNSIEAILNANNSKSIKLLARTNFVKEGSYQDHNSFEGKSEDMVIYKLEKMKEGLKCQEKLIPLKAQ